MQDPFSLRLFFFITILLSCACWEIKRPRKTLTQAKTFRWFNNLSLVTANSLLLIILPMSAFEVALLVQKHDVGILHWLGFGSVTNLLISVILLDLIIYSQHVLFHRISWLWRLHKMHHTDQDIDVTTGARFHPIEIFLSFSIKIASIVLLGVSPLAVVVFEITLNGSAMFNHSNARLSTKLDHWIRRLIVTPDMHRVHHSIIKKETHSNFGFCLAIWDRIFSTYCAQPQQGHDAMLIGTPEFRRPSEQRLDKMLTQPFRTSQSKDI
ncbi:sterol desaturase [Vibrio sp. 10N.286.49.B3]|uniref:sterol desaturase family protein n=1 Tax=Vibrio sp. 10N.286.49.B3 TaxID=1880855 RepID=UPI000C829875|nr:sterol desaturase family protein [Vibrio sp. 10N.286.49.B3]PMH44929.1 sterol desaturase [Vibrio sp. 10N.286.49.B3]